MQGQELRKVAVIGGVRIPFCRSGSLYRDASNFDLLSHVLKALVERYDLKEKIIGDVGLGAVINHVSDFNLAREVVLESGLSALTPAFNVQRACGTSLEAAILIANKIALGQIDSGIVGGSDTNSDAPMCYQRKLARRLVRTQWARNWPEKIEAWKGFGLGELKPSIPAIAEPRTGLTMGQHAERMAQHWGISRIEQDELALDSHRKAAEAYEKGFYRSLVVPFHGVERDNNVRADTTPEKLALLKAAFDCSTRGTLTAGNSTPLTDGAACVLMASEDWARKQGLPIQATWVSGDSRAVDFLQGEGLLMGPVLAVSFLLGRLELTLQDFDFYELHEAFSAQVLCNLRAWESETYCRDRLGRDRAMGLIDRAKINVVGGSIALGHPFGATGARMLATMARLLEEKGAGRGLISTCTAGGMGVAAVIERQP